MKKQKRIIDVDLSLPKDLQEGTPLYFLELTDEGFESRKFIFKRFIENESHVEGVESLNQLNARLRTKRRCRSIVEGVESLNQLNAVLEDVNNKGVEITADISKGFFTSELEGAQAFIASLQKIVATAVESIEKFKDRKD